MSSQTAQQTKQKQLDDLKLRTWNGLIDKERSAIVRIKDYERVLTDQYHHLKHIRAQLRKKPEQVCLQEFIDRISDIPGVERVSFRNTSFFVRTHHITIDHQGDTYDIGKFLIKIDLYRYHIMMWNRTHVIDGHHHPHVSDNQVCFGEVKLTIPKLFSEFMIVELTQILVRFLHGYNMHSPYLVITEWPILPVEKSNEEVPNDLSHDGNDG